MIDDDYHWWWLITVYAIFFFHHDTDYFFFHYFLRAVLFSHYADAPFSPFHFFMLIIIYADITLFDAIFTMILFMPWLYLPPICYYRCWCHCLLRRLIFFSFRFYYAWRHGFRRLIIISFFLMLLLIIYCCRHTLFFIASAFHFSLHAAAAFFDDYVISDAAADFRWCFIDYRLFISLITMIRDYFATMIIHYAMFIAVSAADATMIRANAMLLLMSFYALWLRCRHADAFSPPLHLMMPLRWFSPSLFRCRLIFSLIFSPFFADYYWCRCLLDDAAYFRLILRRWLRHISLLPLMIIWLFIDYFAADIFTISMMIFSPCLMLLMPLMMIFWYFHWFTLSPLRHCSMLIFFCCAFLLFDIIITMLWCAIFLIIFDDEFFAFHDRATIYYYFHAIDMPSFLMSHSQLSGDSMFDILSITMIFSLRHDWYFRHFHFVLTFLLSHYFSRCRLWVFLCLLYFLRDIELTLSYITITLFYYYYLLFHDDAADIDVIIISIIWCREFHFHYYFH